MARRKPSSRSPRSVPSTAEAPAAKRPKARKPPIAERMTVRRGPTTRAQATASSTVAVPMLAPPAVTVPAVPGDFVPGNAADLQGFRAIDVQVAAVPEALAEIRGFADYRTVFGIAAPDPGQLMQRLDVASRWTRLLAESSAWQRYVQAQQGVAWKEALVLLAQLKEPFRLASKANPDLRTEYRALARLLGARTDVAHRAAASRAKNAKEKNEEKAAAAAKATKASDGGG